MKVNTRLMRSEILKEMPLSVLKCVFFVLGLDLSKKAKKTAIISKLYLIILAVLWISYFIHTIITLYCFVSTGNSKLHTFIIQKITDINTLILWFYILKKKDKIRATVDKLFLAVNLSECSKVMLTCICILLGAINIVGWWITVPKYKDEFCSQLLKNYSFLLSENTDNCKLLHLVIAMFIVVRTLETVVTILFVILCYMSRKILLMHCSEKPKLMALSKTGFYENKLKQHFIKYWCAMKVLNSVEQEFAFPVFLLQVNDLMGIFTFLIRYGGYDPGFTVSKAGPAAFTAVRSILSFLVISVAASSVHLADERVKRADEDLWYILLCRGSIMKNNQMGISVVINKKSFAFSAWGCFRFTKSYILSAVGCLLTYSLLIIQLYYSIKDEKYE
ncbi:hypothetical protein HNY73_002538 [Argiope bruennichi]|uniref:Uncharacterized protein n=1 Tax=Argiope bruennichi TaxID=94029 RepID=A0A8T0FTU1_ARGBR|nr:hypothetical protein HNY73_002538 [Argiope bruennichi]